MRMADAATFDGEKTSLWKPCDAQRPGLIGCKSSEPIGSWLPPSQRIVSRKKRSSC